MANRSGAFNGERIGHGDMARSAGAPKKLTPPAINKGMVHRVAGITVQGASRTASQRALNDPVGEVNTPTLAKEGHMQRPAPVHPAFVQPDNHETIGNKILADGVMAAGRNGKPC